jgi:thioredoxin-related protein
VREENVDAMNAMSVGLAELFVAQGSAQDPRLFVKDSEGELICVFPQNLPMEHLPSVLLMIDQALFKGLAWSKRKEKAKALKQLLWT